MVETLRCSDAPFRNSYHVYKRFRVSFLSQNTPACPGLLLREQSESIRYFVIVCFSELTRPTLQTALTFQLTKM